MNLAKKKKRRNSLGTNTRPSLTDLILQDLNPSQKQAVTWPFEKPLLVLAGAGSGKTRVLTRRIAYLLNQGVPSFSVLGITFTNKAAEEMRRRVKQLGRQEVWISTFHSACLRILREESVHLNLRRDFMIYDGQDQLALLKECLKEMNIPARQVHPKGAREMIQKAKDFLMSPYQFIEKAGDDYEERVGKVYACYEKKLARLGALDFGDLLLKTVFLFDRNPKILETWQDRLRYILIDEYQDTNHAQYRFVKLLASKYKQITVVGDPDQLIYGWRGADIRNILNFKEDYAVGGVIKLEQNYRSPAVILDAANALIQHNTLREPKLLWGEKGEGEKITIYEAADEKDEANFVVEEILKYKKSGRSLNEMAIFYRVHAQSRVLEDRLRRVKIPYRIFGGIRFYDRREIKDLLAYLRAVAFPQDDVSLKRILNVPGRGIGKKALELLEEFQRKLGLSLDETLHRAERIPALGSKTQKAIRDFTRMMNAWRKRKDDLSIQKLLEEIIKETRYVELLEEERTVEARARIENIEEFFSVIDDFEGNASFSGDAVGGDLVGFIESISLLTDIDTWEGGAHCLTLMTLHCAKGLEFPIVFMVGLEAGLFPYFTSSAEGADHLEEERRLCYVGITRTQEKLYLTYAHSRRLYKSIHHNLPSRFLTEIPPRLLDLQAHLPNSLETETENMEIDYDLPEDG